GSARLRRALVMGEITLTAVLLVAAGLLLRSYTRVLAADPGFAPRNLLVAETVLPPGRYPERAHRTAFYRDVLERVHALPGVSAAGYVNYPPLTLKEGRGYLSIENRPAPPLGQRARHVVSWRVVSPRYLQALGVPLVQGRHLDERDGPDAAPAVVINQAMARLHWPGGDPLGHRLKLGRAESRNPWCAVVGVVGDVRQMGLDVSPEPEVYFSLDQPTGATPFFWPQHLVVRTQGDPRALAPALRQAVWSVDPEQPVSNVRPMTDVLDAELSGRGTQMTLVAAFAGLALLLAAVGLYGVLSYDVAQRTPEIGIRMALGAQRADVVRSVVRRGLLTAAAGTALGLAGALALARVLRSLLFGVGPTDPVTFAGVAALVLVVAVAATCVPAWRAATIDPVAALRAE
ncbi:MAG TPA: FtsX-like permease family protein, partial [Vicinamibacteria bacterium]|nr:FtsX-like permease family protein [Vicinamibacteria bacterium]